ncbi:MAG: tRNA pseudouridine(55) synthase TruB [Oscillospiraceae bacterium]|nr:tRNA pseudouridine(55) synthase TruB [Oscillospiraceae bacterium]
MNGILIVDKPTDWTSHDVVSKLRSALKIKRIGHGGTLDPMATGVLPVFVGRATRAAEFCENAEKEYIAGLRLGIVTDTQDITGQTLSEGARNVAAEELSAALESFKGAQKQIPPMYSAIKRNGKKLYELARRGIEVERPARDVFISAIEMCGSSGNDYLLRVVCSKGTYIRTICHDIGAKLGTGAAMSSLRRTRAGAFKIEEARTLHDILGSIARGDISKLLQPIDLLFSEHQETVLTEHDAEKVRNGAVFKANLGDNHYRFYGPSGEFLALGEVVGGAGRAIKSFFDPR